MPHPQPPGNSPQSPPARRSDAGKIRLQPRDVDGLVITAEQYAAPYDLLAHRLGVSDDRLRAITARWRDAGLADTGRLAEGPTWCWLTPAGMRQVGHNWSADPPALTRLAHIRAVLAARIWMESGEAWRAYRGWWRCERRIQAAHPGVGQPHRPDAEVIWPSIQGSPRAGETWCIEVELTPKASMRTQQIISGLLAGQYARIVYLCSPAALPVVASAANRFRPEQAARMFIREIAPAALMPRAA